MENSMLILNAATKKATWSIVFNQKVVHAF